MKINWFHIYSYEMSVAFGLRLAVEHKWEIIEGTFFFLFWSLFILAGIFLIYADDSRNKTNEKVKKNV